MKASNRQIYALLDNQENKQQPTHHHIHNYHSTHAPDKITGWDDEKPLLQHNLNTFGTRINKIRENKQVRKYNVLNHPPQSRTSHGRRKTRIISASSSQKNIQSLVQQELLQQYEQNPEPLKYQFSNIELLKFQAKHLEKDEITNNRFPTFSAFNHSEIITNEAQENVNQFQVSEIYEQPSRKLRTQSTKRKKRQVSLSQNAGNNANSSSTSTAANYKFYKTMTNQWIHMNGKNPHLMIQPMLINYNTTCQSKELKLDVSALIGNKKQEQFKTIHWKRNKPFTKFFQYKRNRSRNNTDLQAHMTPANAAKAGLRQLEGRKLNQLLTLNRQVIELEDC